LQIVPYWNLLTNKLNKTNKTNIIIKEILV
jgi:hypothetical protein